MPKPSKPLTKPELVRRAKLRQAAFLQASRKLAEAVIALKHDLENYPSGWPEGVAYPIVDELRDHVELARRVYEDLAKRL